MDKVTAYVAMVNGKPAFYSERGESILADTVEFDGYPYDDFIYIAMLDILERMHDNNIQYALTTRVPYPDESTNKHYIHVARSDLSDGLMEVKYSTTSDMFRYYDHKRPVGEIDISNDEILVLLQNKVDYSILYKADLGSVSISSIFDTYDAIVATVRPTLFGTSIITDIVDMTTVIKQSFNIESDMCRIAVNPKYTMLNIEIGIIDCINAIFTDQNTFDMPIIHHAHKAVRFTSIDKLPEVAIEIAIITTDANLPQKSTSSAPFINSSEYHELVARATRNSPVLDTAKSDDDTPEREQRVAVFAGSFDPFTCGHASIVEQACLIFDRVIILVAINDKKQRRIPKMSMVEAIDNEYRDCKSVSVYDLSDGDTVLKFCQRMRVTFLIRGIRDIMDLVYEKQVADYNKIASCNTLHTVFLRSDVDCVSSSLVWELYKHGNNKYREFLPDAVVKDLENM